MANYEDDEVEERYGVIKKILEKTQKVVTNTNTMGEWNIVVGDGSDQTTAGPHRL
jgi:hypothetical protein